MRQPLIAGGILGALIWAGLFPLASYGAKDFMGTCGQLLLGSFPQVEVSASCLQGPPHPKCQIDWSRYLNQTVVLRVVNPPHPDQVYGVEVGDQRELINGHFETCDPLQLIDTRMRMELKKAVQSATPRAFWVVFSRNQASEQQMAMSSAFSHETGSAMPEAFGYTANALALKGYTNFVAGLLMVAHPFENYPPLPGAVEQLTQGSSWLGGGRTNSLQILLASPIPGRSLDEQFNVFNFMPYVNYSTEAPKG